MSDDVIRRPGHAPDLPAEAVEEFVRLLSQNQRRLLLYILTLVPRLTEAEEILQETNLVLWREYESFQPGTNFLAWAFKVAFFQVLAWRKKQQRDRLEFSDAFLETTARELAESNDHLEQRAEKLNDCLARLPPDQREIIQLRYREGLGVEQIAARLGRTVAAVYRALSRIRLSLYECVSKGLEQS